MKKKIKILHLEDMCSDAELVERELKKGNLQFDKIVVDNSEDYIKALHQFVPDIVLSDHSLPSFNSIEALKILKQTTLDIPFILVTSTMSEEYVVEMMQQGISDYLLKDRMKRLPTAVLNAMKKNIAEKEKKKSLQQMAISEALLKEAQGLAHMGSFSFDIQTNIAKWSDEFYKLLGYSPGDIHPSFENLLMHIHPEEMEQFKTSTEHAINKLDFLHREFRLKLKNGIVKFINSDIHIERDEFKKAIRIKGFSQDITERVLLERKLVEEKLKSQQEITDAVIEAQEKERSFLGQELHDNINQILATSKLYMEVALSDENLRKDLVQNGRDYLMNAMEEIRKLSKSLLPPSLGGTTLLETLNELIDDLRLVNEISFIKEWKNIDENLLDEKLSLAIFRIVQEQLNNTLKHAKASSIHIALKQSSGNLQLIIKDDGIGFNINEKRNGIGLKNILSRTNLFNGKMQMNTKEGKGCELIIDFEIKPKQ